MGEIADVQPPTGYRVLTEGNTQDGDLQWCPVHGAWEDVEDAACAVWAYVLVARRLSQETEGNSWAI